MKDHQFEHEQRPDGFYPLDGHSPTPWDCGRVPDGLEIEDWFTPQVIRETLDRLIIGQDKAKKAASMIIYSLMEYDRVSTSLFIGETGSGKTEIWRILSEEWRGLVSIADASQITAEGWKGDVKIRDLMNSFHPGGTWRRHILVLDEFDKIWDQKNSDVNYYDMIQGQLLKIFDHDPGVFPDGIDPSDVSIVCLGAFSRIYENKKKKAESIGFGEGEAHAREEPGITKEDLAEYGLKPELIARFDRIVIMDPPSFETYRKIADIEVEKLRKTLGIKVEVSSGLLDAVASEALSAGLGGRYIRRRLFSMAEDAIYDDPYTRSVVLDDADAGHEEP